MSNKCLQKANSWSSHIYIYKILYSRIRHSCYMNNSSNFERHFCATRQNKKINKSINWPIGRLKKSTHTMMHLVASQMLIIFWYLTEEARTKASELTPFPVYSYENGESPELTKNICLAPTYTTSVLSHIAINRRISIYFRSMHFFTYYLTGNLPAQLPF